MNGQDKKIGEKMYEGNGFVTALRVFGITTILLILSLLLILFLTGNLGPLFNQVDYNNSQTDPTRLNAIAGRISKDCVEIARTSDPVAKKAIENDIYDMTKNVNPDIIQMPDDVRVCMNSARQDVLNGNK